MNEIKYTHLLCCKHFFNSKSCKTYYMKCNKLKETKSSIKLEIIGERYWDIYDNKRSIRYLPKNESWRLREV